MKAVVLLFMLTVLAAGAAPSKQAESDSIDVAHRELERMTGLNTKAQYKRFICEISFYESVDDPTALGPLTEEEKRALRKLAGTRSFFLHRFTPKKMGSEVFEVLVGDDGQTLIGSQKKPSQLPEPTSGLAPGRGSS